jgi:hypothetical protein
MFNPVAANDRTDGFRRGRRLKNACFSPPVFRHSPRGKLSLCKAYDIIPYDQENPIAGLESPMPSNVATGHPF